MNKSPLLSRILSIAFISCIFAIALNAAPPVILSSLTDSAVINQPYEYTITASDATPPNPDVTFGAAGLPQGLSVDQGTGVISGAPTQVGDFAVTLFVQNADGTDVQTLQITVLAAVPKITSPNTDTADEGEAFSYQFMANFADASFSLVAGFDVFQSLGLSFNPVTGVISGTPVGLTQIISSDIIVSAANGDASITANGLLKLTVIPAAVSDTVPTITSELGTIELLKGEFFTYEITATNNPIAFAAEGTLPDGLTRTGAVISGIPTEAGTSVLKIFATNSFGASEKMNLVLDVKEPTPVITSLLTIGGEVDDELTYQITADNSPTSFAAIGLDAINGLSLDPNSGVISGAPFVSGDFDVIIEATNDSGTGREVLRFVIMPEVEDGTGPAVSIVSINGISPASDPVFDFSDADNQELVIVAQVTPNPDEVVESVFVRWNNPPATASGIATILAELQPAGPIPSSGPITFTGTVDVGFNPDNREIGAGAVALEVVATGRTGSDLNFGTSDEAVIEIAPLVDYLFPVEGLAVNRIGVGEVFASVRLNTNAFERVTAQISGVGIIETVTDDDASDNPNGVFNFLAETLIEFPGEYEIRITAEDSIGNEIALDPVFITVANAPTTPVVSVVSPTPGFSTEVFSPAIFTFEQFGAPNFDRNDDGVVTETRITYNINQVTEGRGYYPRNDGGVNLVFDFGTGTANVSDNQIVDGRLPEIDDQLTIVFQGASNGYGPSGSGVVDSAFDPGQPAQIEIASEFFRADSALSSFKIFVNGEDVTPGAGNLDPLAGPIDAPSISYPALGSPDPGDYVVIVQVTDRDGEIGVSAPLSFSVVPFKSIDIALTRQGSGPVNQGSNVTYYIDIDQLEQIDVVEIFDSSSAESLGLATRVNVNGEVRYRFSQNYSEAGIFSIFAEATTFEGQTVRSNSAVVQVQPFNDLVAEITSPVAQNGQSSIVRELFIGESINITASASSTPGVASFEWIVNNTVEETDTGRPYAFARQFDTVGTFLIRGEALDNFGNRQGTEEITVIVSRPELTIEITDPIGDQTVSAGESITFTASATSELSVTTVVWYVNDLEIETDSTKPYELTHVFPTTGVSNVRAEATDSLGNIETTPNVFVQVNEPNPNTSDVDFVSDIFNRLVGRVPNQTERDEAAELLDGSLEQRVAFITEILESDLLDSSTFVQIVYRTMTGEWPNAAQLAEARTSLTDSVAGGNSQTGSIVPGGTQTFEFDFVAGNSVTVSVTGDSAEGVPLGDPTLTINDPNGNFVAYSDDSFQGFGFSLDPLITFVPQQTGTYTAVVGGWSIFNFGGFTINASTVGGGNEGSALSAEALVTALIPEYEERFGEFLTDVSNPLEARPFVTQIFENKHGVAPNTQALTRLGDALTGGSIAINGELSPGYGGDVEAFVAGFATDNELSRFEGAGGMPLTDVLYYSRPNDATRNAALALAISALLGEDPTDEFIASFRSGSLEETVEKILTDSRYFEQFPSGTAESFVALRMAEVGVYDTNLNGPEADADGDGDSNLKEVALGTNPNDSSETTPALAATIDSGDFVVEFVRIKESLAPDDLSILIECSPSLLAGSWEAAVSEGAITLAPDQTGVDEDYERVQFRIDMSAQDCSFVRVSVK